MQKQTPPKWPPRQGQLKRRVLPHHEYGTLALCWERRQMGAKATMRMRRAVFLWLTSSGWQRAARRCFVAARLDGLGGSGFFCSSHRSTDLQCDEMSCFFCDAVTHPHAAGTTTTRRRDSLGSGLRGTMNDAPAEKKAIASRAVTLVCRSNASLLSTRIALLIQYALAVAYVFFETLCPPARIVFFSCRFSELQSYQYQCTRVHCARWRITWRLRGME